MCFRWGALLPFANGLSCCSNAKSPAHGHGQTSLSTAAPVDTVLEVKCAAALRSCFAACCMLQQGQILSSQTDKP